MSNDDKSGDDNNKGKIFSLDRFRKTRKEVGTPAAPEVPKPSVADFPVTPEGSIDYSGLTPPEKFAPLIDIINDIGEVPSNKMVEKCATAKRLIEQNSEWLRQPIVYNSIFELFSAHRNNPAIRNLFITYCEHGHQDVLALQLKICVDAIAKSRWTARKGEELDAVRIMLRFKPALVEEVTRNIVTARTEGGNNAYLDALDTIVKETRAKLVVATPSKPMKLLQHLRQVISKIGGHTPDK